VMEENNLLLKRLLQFNYGGNLPGPSFWSSWKCVAICCWNLVKLLLSLWYMNYWVYDVMNLCYDVMMNLCCVMMNSLWNCVVWWWTCVMWWWTAYELCDVWCPEFGAL
jgi:hypothetical protein